MLMGRDDPSTATSIATRLSRGIYDVGVRIFSAGFVLANLLDEPSALNGKHEEVAEFT